MDWIAQLKKLGLYDAFSGAGELAKSAGGLMQKGYNGLEGNGFLEKAFGNKDSMGAINGTLGSIGAVNSFLNARRATDLAGEQFNFQRNLGQQNYGNSVDAYNTQLGNRARQASSFNPNSPNTDNYLAQNRIDKVTL